MLLWTVHTYTILCITSNQNIHTHLVTVIDCTHILQLYCDIKSCSRCDFSSLSSIGPVGSAICIYRAGVGINGGIYQTYAQGTRDFTEDPPIPRENENFLCNAAEPRDDNIAMFRVESVADVGQMTADPILVLNGYT